MTTVELEQQRLLIGGEWTEVGGGGTFERTNPFTGDAVTLAAAAGAEDAVRAVDAAAAAFPAWSATPAGERRALLNAAADKLMEAAPDIAGVMTEEVGGTTRSRTGCAASGLRCRARRAPASPRARSRRGTWRR